VSATAFAWLALLASIAASIAGQALLKAGSAAADFRAQLFDPRSVAGLAAYALAALLYMLALRRLPMSVALPFTALTYVAAALVGRWAFAEQLNLVQLAAIAMICAGAVTLAVGSN
jgi:multidrug transporter EmrE-like cation transporter